MITPNPLVEDSYSFSGNLQIRLKERTMLFRYLMIINLIFGGWYLQWRITNSINFSVWWISIPLLLAEIYCYLGGVMFYIGLWRPLVREIRSLKFMRPPLPKEQIPKVDVFITCYNEPVDMVETTAKAALKMDYPVSKLKVYVLDDGNSLAMREMAQNLCLQDLQSPELQAEADLINQKRSQLMARLAQIQILSPEISKAQKILDLFHLEVNGEADSFAQVLIWFEEIKPIYVPLRTWLECQTALGEGFDNALRHAHKDLPPKTAITIDILILSQGIEIKIWDQGKSFDWQGKIKNLPAEIDVLEEHGRGMVMLQELMDSSYYTTTPDQRNCLILFKSYEATADIETEGKVSQLTGYLQSFQELILQSYPHLSSLDDYLKQVQQSLEKEIYDLEIELSNLGRACYIARPKPKGKPHHAKAGNINYAIFSGETNGDLILTLDADHIPQPQFLQRVVPYFFQYNINTGKYDSNQIAFVQTPQAFYNLPPGDPFGHQAHLFYGLIQQSKDGMNSAFYTGTNAILRREALVNVGLQNFSMDFNEDRLAEFDLVGGMSSNSITEDMNTAMRLHAAGWKSVYHNEELSAGLAPDDLISTLQQRLRWAQGTIQVLLRESPFSKNKEGLSFFQQLQYFQTMYSYFAGFFILIFLISPIIYFFTGIIPVNAYGNEFAIHFFPAFILNRITFTVACWGIPAGELWRSEQYAIGLFPLFIQAVISVFSGKPLSFKVTPKQRQSGMFLGLIIPQLTIIILTSLGILWSLYRLLQGQLENPGVTFLNIGWSIYNISLLWVMVKAATWQPSVNQ
ncbi:glycosyltransferase family 2 protein [Geminocystis sp. GBBB08]|uniref:glycosyltransferase family 2 protein n=1 Tax=Geminocystis sp. GBBB08 TaxID=2604140 RepID=UPI0027E37074|nr:glycosyltransferase family 2 protein [Geminocystis sp. GBBB08]MBL1210868.1 glycosyltransferase [Geminocystis sp. GBBB08]